MLENLLYNQNKWEALMDQEIAEETKTEISDADIVEDDIEINTNISDSSELLLPLRRCSFNPAKPTNLKQQLRRFSVPLNVFQDSKFKIKQKSRESLAELKVVMGSAQSIQSQLSVGVQYERNDDSEKVLSTEKLLPDLSITSITTPVQATRLCAVIKDSGTSKLIRQQTFPPLVTVARSHTLLSRPMCTSNEEAVYPSHRTTDFTLTLEDRLNNLFKEKDIKKTDKDDASETSNVSVVDGSDNRLRENVKSALKQSSEFCGQDNWGSQLRDNLSSIHLSSSEQLFRRRKSMPTDVIAFCKFTLHSQLKSNSPFLLKQVFIL